MGHRTVKALHVATRDDIGDLVTRRPLPGASIEQLDPFLFLNHHGPQIYPPNNRGLPFGPHPHRGFETVTFIVEGELAHRDSAGHESVIRAGGVQWMTAGRGIVHAEISPDAFRQHGGALEILQLWVNLPARMKMTPPRYVGLQRDGIPTLDDQPGAIVHLIAGSWRNSRGPVETLTDMFMATVELAPGASFVMDGLARDNVFLYVVHGAIRVADHDAGAFTLVELHRDGDTLAFSANETSLLLLGHAPPIGEPVVAHGPFVMNTPEEIQQAIRDYQDGRFGAAMEDES